jgi:hypothetical protein
MIEVMLRKVKEKKKMKEEEVDPKKKKKKKANLSNPTFPHQCLFPRSDTSLPLFRAGGLGSGCLCCGRLEVLSLR